ncbi:ABC transporter ATP-binding protein [Halobacillus sp. A5]|uniref:ABC transporter ATP-binding protein n=1 Tax=Halobacillus sp. A5 TaxID=2880263 RepID=UPI0020A63A0E|nr:ABC transporter ATP-binding protein [Halobacillus sp. A5]MCP3027647.1 ATP-binding cassette domain-containing protein [Halobacillus sp. A5]
MKPIIELSDVHFRYPGATENVLNGATLSIEQGEFLAVIGGNGSGKTTLCKTFNGLIPNYYTGDFSGSIMVDGSDVSQMTVSEMSFRVGYVYQDYENQLMRPTVLDDVSFAPLNFGAPDFMEKALWALETLGIEHLKDQSIWQLSGGQKHLAAIAGVLALDPQILIIDEPVAQLDPHHAKEIYQRLKVLQEDFGKTIIVIEHHTEFIADFCTDVLLVDQGKVLWKHPVRQGLLQIEDLVKRDIFPPQVMQAALNCEIPLDSSDFPMTIADAQKYFHGLQFIEKESESDRIVEKKEQIASLENLSFSAKTLSNERKTILNKISTSFHAGERIALVGTNGAGKTSLMKCLTGMNKPTSGGGSIGSHSFEKGSLEKLSQEVSYIFQNPEEMFIQDSIKNDLTFFSQSRERDDSSFIEKLIQSFRLEEVLEKDGRLLSGGQQRRASMAIGLATNPTLLMLDEPTASLDVQSRKELIEILQEMDSVATALVATHDMQLVAEWATRVIVMEQGEVTFDGTPREMFDYGHVWKRAGLVPPQIVQLSIELGMRPAALSVNEFTSRIKEGVPDGVC